VIDELVRLQALMPDAGCRRVTDVFNRLHLQRKRVSVSKSYVSYTLRSRRHEVLLRRRALRARAPGAGPANRTWAMDMTGKVDATGRLHMLLGVIDHGSRRLLELRALPAKGAWTLLGYLCLAIGRCGKPRCLRTDNEAVFTSGVFRGALRLLGIRHQRSDVGCPWQNGRIERLFGTLKGKLRHWQVASAVQLQLALDDFSCWYNEVRPHQHLTGATPVEAWRGIDPYARAPTQVRWFEAWDGLLTGYRLRH
jgi:transposase InsO family protein